MAGSRPAGTCAAEKNGEDLGEDYSYAVCIGCLSLFPGRRARERISSWGGPGCVGRERAVKKMGDAVTTRRERLEGECARVEATLKGAMDHNIHTRSSDGLGGAEIKVSRDPRVQARLALFCVHTALASFVTP